MGLLRDRHDDSGELLLDQWEQDQPLVYPLLERRKALRFHFCDCDCDCEFEFEFSWTLKCVRWNVMWSSGLVSDPEEEGSQSPSVVPSSACQVAQSV